MYSVVYIYGGVISHVEIGSDYEALKKEAIALGKDSGFDPKESDCIEIWDDEGRVKFSYEEEVYSSL